MKLMCTEYKVADAFACMHVMHVNIAIFTNLLLFYVICAWQVASWILLQSYYYFIFFESRLWACQPTDMWVSGIYVGIG